MKFIILFLFTLFSYSQQVVVSAGENNYTVGQTFYLSNGEGIQNPIDNILNIDYYNFNNIMFYPNPTTGIIKINIDYHTFYLFDLNGRQIQKGIIIDKIINITSQRNGIYILKVGNKTIKIIKL